MAGPEPFVLFRDDLAGRETLFCGPRKLIVAADEGQFFAALDEMEEARDAGKWLAGYFSYEAGYLFEPKLAPLIPRDRRAPLIAFGVFDGPVDEAPKQSPPASNGPIFEAHAAWTFADYERRFRRVHQHLRE